MFECGRAQATLSTTTLQSDQEEYIQNLLKAVAQKLGNNVNIRQSPAYSSQSQGSIERFHRTLMGQVRALVQQVTTSYNLTLSVQHPIMPWIVRHATWLLNRYAMHNDGQTSYQRRWQKDPSPVNWLRNGRRCPTLIRNLTRSGVCALETKGGSPSAVVSNCCAHPSSLSKGLLFGV